ncbi:MAG: hypothetical protein AAF217_00600 [Pseudomonadota bacterium]
MPRFADIFKFSIIWGLVGSLAGASFALLIGGNLWPLTGILTGLCSSFIAFVMISSYHLIKHFDIL